MAFNLSLCFRVKDAEEEEACRGPGVSRSGWGGRGGREEEPSQCQEEAQFCGCIYCYIRQRWRGQWWVWGTQSLCWALLLQDSTQAALAVILGSGFAQRVLCHSFSYIWDESNPIWLGNEQCASWGWVMSLGFDNQILSELNLKRNLKVTFPQSLYKSFFHNFYLIDFQLNLSNMILYYVQIDKKMIQNSGLWVAQRQAVSGKLVLNYRSLSL